MNIHSSDEEDDGGELHALGDGAFTMRAGVMIANMSWYASRNTFLRDPEGVVAVFGRGSRRR